MNDFDCLPFSKKLLHIYPKKSRFLLTHITLDNDFSVGDPSKVLSKFGHVFDSLTHIVFGDRLDVSVDWLPPSVLHLTFGPGLNTPIDKLPPDLKSLVLADNFNFPVDQLPLSLAVTAVLANLAAGMPVPAAVAEAPGEPELDNLYMMFEKTADEEPETDIAGD